MNFGSFYKNINIKFKNNADLDYFKTNGYCDFRCGCDLCSSGQAFGIKTNILNFSNNKDYFNLDRLDLEYKDTWYENESLNLHLYYETTNKECINKIYNYFLYFQENTITKNYNNHDEIESSVSIESIFDGEDIKSITSVHLCANCYTWFSLLNNNLINNFQKQKSIKYFWKDFITDDILDLIEFDNNNSKKIFTK